MKCAEIVLQRNRVTGVVTLLDLDVLRIQNQNASDDEILSKLREVSPACGYEFGLLQVRE